MEKFKKTVLRASRKITDIFLLGGILAFLIIILGFILSRVIIHITGAAPVLTLLFNDEGISTFLLMYFEFFGIWIVFFLIISVFKNNRPMWRCLAFRKGGNSISMLFIGLLLGFLTNGFCILMSCVLGDIKLSYDHLDPALFISFFIVVMIQSGAEEIVDRCYLYQKLRRRYRHPAVAIIVNSLVFMSMHFGNEGINVLGMLQLLVVGIVFSMYVYYYDCLWTAIMFHTGWNFTQSIVFGLPNSGIVSKYSLFRLDAASARNGIFYNVGFGVEGSAGAVTVLIAVMVVLLLINRGKGEKKDLWKEMEERNNAIAEQKSVAAESMGGGTG